MACTVSTLANINVKQCCNCWGNYLPLECCPQRPPCTVIPKGLPEFPAIAADESRPNFSVLVTAQAPTLIYNADHLKRAPIDLVLVLDVSGSMSGDKISLLKDAVLFIIDNLGHRDRLAMVTFSTDAKRIFPMQTMSDHGRKAAASVVNSLSATGNRTNILNGLTEGARIIEQRPQSESNNVSSIIFLSDGEDTVNVKQTTRSSLAQVPHYVKNLPNSIYPQTQAQGQLQSKTIPVHSFGLGFDHDSTAMNDIAIASGGTYSFLESNTMIRRAFAMCIGGLLSVVVRELQLTVTCASPGVEIISISSGSYSNTISPEKIRADISVGDLYGDEKKDFLVHLKVPSAVQNKRDACRTCCCCEEKTPLLDIRCSYKDVVTKNTVQVICERVEIRRPKVVISPVDTTVNLEVDRQRNRVLVAEAMEKVLDHANKGQISKAKDFLKQNISTVRSSQSAKVEDAFCNFLVAGVEEIIQKMESVDMYENIGRPLLLSSLSSHKGQKVTTRCYAIVGGIIVGDSYYSTPVINKMVYESQRFTNPAYHIEAISAELK